GGSGRDSGRSLARRRRRAGGGFQRCVSAAIANPWRDAPGAVSERSGPAAARVNRAASSATSQAKSRRTCAGCGRKAPQGELIRFVAHEASLTPAAGAPGRGVYTCRRLACFERARARAAFNRVLRQTVRVDPALARLYTDADGL